MRKNKHTAEFFKQWASKRNLTASDLYNYLNDHGIFINSSSEVFKKLQELNLSSKSLEYITSLK